MPTNSVAQSNPEFQPLTERVGSSDYDWLNVKFAQHALALFYRSGDAKFVRKLPSSLHTNLLAKLRLVARSKTLKTIGYVKGNQLKSMKGKHLGKYSIYLNDKYRILFSWSDDLGAKDIALIHFSKQ